MLRAPLVHFLVLGALLLAVRSAWQPPPAARPRIVLDAADVTRLRETWTAERGTPPGPAAETALVQDAVDEEILYREAIAAGFDRGDAAVRERLVRLGSFVGEETAGDRAALEGEARRLGLERSDVVIRRHLVEMMRLALEQPAPGDAPSDAELESYRTRHAAELAEAPTVRLTQVYFSAQARGEAALADAARALDEMRRADAGVEAAAGRGDAFIRGADVGPASRADLERVFGGDFAATVDQMQPGAWAGPVRSSYGVHLVWVRERLPGRVPPLAAIRGRLVLGLLEERGAGHAVERLRALRQRYDVDVAGG
jgi:hypothetical protein